MCSIKKSEKPVCRLEVRSELETDGESPLEHSVSTTNPCKVCSPLGACLAFRGAQGCIPFLHGSQGCATYIRRYLISHFREPMDIASSNFHEETAVFGGARNLEEGLENVIRQYQPELIGLATTCLAETIGEDTDRLLVDWRRDSSHSIPLVTVSTASYRGTHMDGFHAAVAAMVKQHARFGFPETRMNLFPGMVSAEDLRLLKEILSHHFPLYSLLPDYSETLDGGVWESYQKVPKGGTSMADIVATGRAIGSIEFGRTLENTATAGSWLQENMGIVRHLMGMPIGLRETDRFLQLVERLSGKSTPDKYIEERARLVDAMVDGHKYVFGKRAIVFGEEDLVIGLAAFLGEIGVHPVLCASGGRSGRFVKCLKQTVPELPSDVVAQENFDFAEMSEAAETLKPDFLLGSSKGYALARRLGVPLVRVGFPVHDRLGGQRIRHLGYGGALDLYDRIVNTLLEVKQMKSPVGYSYL